MAKIKTKETVKDIKALDKAADVSTRMKESFVRTKERTTSLNDDGQNSANEHAENQVESGMRDAAYDVGHGAKDGTKNAIRKGKESYRNHKDLKKAELKKEPDATGSSSNHIQRNQRKPKAKNGTEQKKYRIKTKDSKKHSIKQSARSTGKKTVKTSKATIKQTERTVKTAEKTTQKAIKTAEKTAKATKEAAKVSAKAAQKAAQAAKAATKAAVATAKAAAKAVVAAVKAIIAGVKALVAAIAAGGWVSVIVIIVICLISLIVGSVFGIFLSGGGDAGTSITIQAALEEVNTDYNNRLQAIKDENEYDELDVYGNRANWKDVLALYAAKTSTDPEHSLEIATMDASKT